MTHHYFDAYKATVLQSSAAPIEALKVAAEATSNAVNTLRRGIKHKADDEGLYAMQGDSEWLSLWAGSVSTVLSSGEYPDAELYFAGFGIAA